MAALTAALYEANNSTKVADLTNSFDREFSDQINDVGSWRLSIGADDANAVALIYGRLVRFSVDGDLAFTGRIEKRDVTTVDTDEEYGQTVTVSGRSHLAEWADAVVYPALPIGQLPVHDVRYFNWAEPNLSTAGWSSAIQRYQPTDATSPVGGQDWAKGWPYNASDWWIWSRGASIADPVGSSYFRGTFTVASDQTIAIFVTADDGFDLWLDGIPLAINTEPFPAETWRNVYRYGAKVTAGTHTIAVRAENYNRDWGPTLNIGNLIVAIWSVNTSTTILSDRVSGSSSAWKCLDYPATAPGWTAGGIVAQLLADAQAAGSLTTWSLAGNATTDAGGVAWPTLTEQTFRVGTPLLDVLKQLSDSGHIDYDAEPGTKTLTLWRRGTYGAVQAVTLASGTNVSRAAYATQAPPTNVLVAKYRRGYVQSTNASSVSAYGRHVGYLEIDVDDVGQAQTLADAYTSAYSAPQVNATIEVDPASLSGSTVPYYGDWQPGDTITAPDETGAGVAYRVQGVTARDSAELINTTGAAIIEWTAELNTKLEDDTARIAEWLRRIQQGALSGRSSSASPVSDLAPGIQSGKIDVKEIAYGQSGIILADTSGRYHPDKPERLVRIEVSVGVTDTASITVTVLKNGSSVGTITLPAGQYVARTTFNGVYLGTFDYLQVSNTGGNGLAEKLTAKILLADSV